MVFCRQGELAINYFQLNIYDNICIFHCSIQKYVSTVETFLFFVWNNWMEIERMAMDEWGEMEWKMSIQSRYAFHFISYHFAMQLWLMWKFYERWAQMLQMRMYVVNCTQIHAMMDWSADWNYYAPSWNVASINHRHRHHRIHAYCILHCEQNRMWQMAA